jgi:hypothetical protein
VSGKKWRDAGLYLMVDALHNLAGNILTTIPVFSISDCPTMQNRNSGSVASRNNLGLH